MLLKENNVNVAIALILLSAVFKIKV